MYACPAPVFLWCYLEGSENFEVSFSCWLGLMTMVWEYRSKPNGFAKLIQMVRVHDTTQQAMTMQFLPDGEKLPQRSIDAADGFSRSQTWAMTMQFLQAKNCLKSCLIAHRICPLFFGTFPKIKPCFELRNVLERVNWQNVAKSQAPSDSSYARENWCSRLQAGNDNAIVAFYCRRRIAQSDYIIGQASNVLQMAIDARTSIYLIWQCNWLRNRNCLYTHSLRPQRAAF